MEDKEFIEKQNKIICDLEEEFYKYHNKKNEKILAVSLLNKEKINTWHLTDFNLIETFANKNPLIKVGNLTLNAQNYPACTKLVYDIDKDKKYLLTPEKIDHLNDKNIDISQFELLAERTRIANYGEVWQIESESLKNLFHQQLLAIKFLDTFYYSEDYNEKVFIVKDNYTNQKKFVNSKGQIVMKKQKK